MIKRLLLEHKIKKMKQYRGIVESASVHKKFAKYVSIQPCDKLDGISYVDLPTAFKRMRKCKDVPQVSLAFLEKEDETIIIDYLLTLKKKIRLATVDGAYLISDGVVEPVVNNV